MLRLLSLLITLPLSVFVLLFAVSNTHTVTVNLYILEWTAEWPLYATALGLMAAGFLAGGLMVWLNLYHYRVRYWQARRKLTKFETAAKDAAKPASAAPDPAPPPAPPRLAHAAGVNRQENTGPVNPYQAAFDDN